MGLIPSKRSHLTIAFFTRHIDELTGFHMLSDTITMARRYQCSLVTFFGGQMGKSLENIAYKLCAPQQFDGFLNWATPDTGQLGWFDIFRGRPLVSLTTPIPGHPVVDIDSYNGAREAVLHLVRDHGCRRIAFIRGSEDHVYSQDRYRAYVDALAESGIVPDESLVTPTSDFTKLTGFRAVNILMDERRLRVPGDIDGIVATNDNILIGVIQEFRKRGVRVPRDVAGVSLNSTLEGRTYTPTLTSVATPFIQQVETAMVTLTGIIRGERAPNKITLPSRLLMNKSCGCHQASGEKNALSLSRDVAMAAGPRQSPEGHSRDEASFSIRNILEETREMVVRYVGDEIGLTCSDADTLGMIAGKLAASFADSMEAGSESGFIGTLDEVLGFVSENNGKVVPLHHAVSILRHQFHRYNRDPGLVVLAEDILHQARMTISEVIHRNHVNAGLAASRFAQNFRKIGTRLISTFGLTPLLGALRESLKEIGIPSFYLCLYESIQEYSFPDPLPEWSRLIFAARGDKVTIDVSGKRFRTSRLLPDDVDAGDARCDFIVIPLIFNGHHLGYALAEFGPIERNLYTAFMEQLSCAIMGSYLMEERKKNARLADELQQADKLTAIGQLAGGVAHDFNNQLTAILACADIISHDPDALPHIREYANIICKAARHSAELTGNLLAFARKGKIQVRPVDLHRLIDETATMLERSIDKRIVIEKHLEAQVSLTLGDPVQLENALLNLGLNA
ncbi:MAG: hypothetical protein EHM28_06490, partial [Spirochaetaceae bacterium]